MVINLSSKALLYNTTTTWWHNHTGAHVVKAQHTVTILLRNVTSSPSHGSTNWNSVMEYCVLISYSPYDPLHMNS